MSAPTPTVEAESRAFVPFNVNEYVRVKLTERGVNILRRRHERMADSFPNVGAFSEPERDAEGWSSFQLWALMSNFGADIGNGLPVPFETTIEFGVAAAPSPATGGVETAQAAFDATMEIIDTIKARPSGRFSERQKVELMLELSPAYASPPHIAGPTKEEVIALMDARLKVQHGVFGSFKLVGLGETADDILALFNGASK